MRRTITHYLSVYQGFLNSSLSQVTSFRLHFLLMLVMDLVFYASTMGSISFIYQHVDRIGVWSESEFLFFISFMLVVDQLQMSISSENFWLFSWKLRKGDLDFDLLKPIGSLFITFFHHIRPTSFLSLFVSGSLLIYYGQKIHLDTIGWVALPFLIVLSYLLMITIEMIVSCSMFWMIEGLGINFLRMQIQTLSRWPDFIYSQLIRRVLTLGLPILLVGNAPVHFLINHDNWSLIIHLIIALILCFIVLKWLWNRGLRQYESASS